MPKYGRLIKGAMQTTELITRVVTLHVSIIDTV